VPFSAAAEALRVAAAPQADEEAEVAALGHVLLPRKQKELYKAMQMGNAKKKAQADTLRARKAAC